MFIDKVFDAVVIGGGPAGLSGALFLARLRRSVLIVDEGRGRALRIPRSHNYPGFPDGVEGAQLVAAIQHQALRHGVNFAAGRVTRLQREGAGFTVAWADAQAHARTVLLATGASDVQPTLPHLSEALHAGALRYCPICDGYEVLDRVVGVLGDGPAGVAEALYLRHFTTQVSLYAASADAVFSDDDRRRLAAAGVTFIAEPTQALRLEGDRIAVRHGDRESVCAALYCALGMQVHSGLAATLGARRDADGYLWTDAKQQTSVAGLYAVGDVAEGLNQISVATGGAATAASAMHWALST